MSHADKRQITCFMNNICNAACRYCYAHDEQQETPLHLDRKFAMRAIREYFRADHCELRFFGSGEPTLDLELMKELRSYAAGIVGEDRLVTEIQTNGYYADAEVAHWLGRNITNIWLSWDGPADIQNDQRPMKTGGNAAAAIEDAARIMIQEKDRGARGFVGARPTITRRTVERQKELIDYWTGFGIKAMYSTPIFMPVSREGSAYPADLGPIDFTIYTDAYLDAREYALTKGAFYGSFLMINFDKRHLYHCRSCLPAPHLTYDGYVSCCDMAMSARTPQHMHDLLYGRWVPERDRIEYCNWKIERMRSRMAMNIARCRDCELSENCAGGCLGEALNETKEFYGMKTTSCEATKYLAGRLAVNGIDIPYLHP